MKHPALTRVFAIVVALLGLTMAMAGGLGLRSAEEDRQSALYTVRRLRERAASYREITDSLRNTEAYADQNAALEEKQSGHDSESSEHRADVSTYTLTNFGLTAGTNALDLADQQFASYKAVFEEAMPVFEEGLGQASSLLGALRQVYDAAMDALDDVNAHLDYANAVAASLSAGEAVTYADVTAACDQQLALLDELAAVPDQLRELTPALDAISAFDPESLTALLDAMEKLPASLGSFGNVDLSAYAGAGVPVDFDLDRLVRLKAVYDEGWSAVKQALEREEIVSAALEQGVEDATGMSFADLRQQMQDTRDRLAAHGEEPIDPQLSDAALEGFNLTSGAVREALDRANTAMETVNTQASELGGSLAEIEGVVYGFNGLLSQARQMLYEGENALYWARAAIWYQMGQQREKEEALRKHRDALAQEAEELRKLSEQAEAQKKAEQRQRSLRAILLRRDEIRSRVDAGEEPDAAALAYARERENQAETENRLRARACHLMLVGGLFALLAIPTAFERIRSRFLLLLTVLLCLGCAAAAEWIFYQMGRGHSYSALAVAVFALLQLFVTLPKAPKAG